MKIIKYLILSFLLTSCATINVNYDYDKEIDFSKYKTYHFYSDLDTGLSALDAKRLIAVLNETLQSKGFALSETPDFFINITSSEYQNNQRNSVGVGVGGGGRRVGGGLSVGIPIGSSKFGRQIIFDFIDENGIGLFWQAVSESSYNPNASPENRAANLKSIVIKVLSGYPPKK